MQTKNKNVQLPELLAPAGSAEGLRAVIRAGADAVYIGARRFGARAYAQNPDEEEMLEAIDYAHLRGARVYLTVNTLLKDGEIGDLYDFLLPYYRQGVDAVLVQDFGVLSRIGRLFPDLPLHASTQMTITDARGAAMLRGLHVTRIVRARELSLRELTDMKRESGLEIEVFVHGALCYCYSGQCLYSSLLGGRSGNRGRCAQPCRLLYLRDDGRFDGSTSILLEKEARHFLSPKDLCTIDMLPQLVLSGMDSLKIEGRMKRPEYAAGVVSVYRRNLDRIGELLSAKTAESADDVLRRYRVSPEDHQMLYDLYNRSGFTDGYFHRRSGPEMMALVKHELTGGETDARHALYAEMHERYMTAERTLPVDMHITVREGEPITAVVTTDEAAECVSGPVVSGAQKRPLTEERILEHASKTGGTDFHIRTLTADTDGHSFVPVSALNELRRGALAAIRQELLRPYMRPDPADGGIPAENVSDAADGGIPAENVSDAAGQRDDLPHIFASAGEYRPGLPYLSASVRTREQLDAIVSTQFVSKIYLESAMFYRDADPAGEALRLVRLCVKRGIRPYIALPFVARSGKNAEEITAAHAALMENGLAGYLVRGAGQFAFAKSMKEQPGTCPEIRLDAGMYTWNRDAVNLFRGMGADGFTAPFELNRKELFGRDNRDSEIIVYGAVPLMVTANCIFRNTDRCTRRNDRLTLTDRIGARFAVQSECAFCYNLIYNSVPLMLLRETETIRRMGFEGMRLSFTGESGSVTERILRETERAAGGEKPEFPFETTRGHFLRGVE